MCKYQWTVWMKGHTTPETRLELVEHIVLNTKLLPRHAHTVVINVHVTSFIIKAFPYKQDVKMKKHWYSKQTYRKVWTAFTDGWNYTFTKCIKITFRQLFRILSNMGCNLCSLTCRQLLSLGLFSVTVSSVPLKMNCKMEFTGNQVVQYSSWLKLYIKMY